GILARGGGCGRDRHSSGTWRLFLWVGLLDSRPFLGDSGTSQGPLARRCGKAMADALTALIWPRFRRHAIAIGRRRGQAGERTPSMSAISGIGRGQKRVQLMVER